MATRTATTRTRKTAATAVSPAKTRTRRAAVKDPSAELMEDIVAAIEDGSLDGHLSALDAALSARADASGAAKRTRSTAAKSASAKPVARKTASAKLKLEDLETGVKYKVVDGTKSSRGVDISGQRVEFERKAKKGGVEVAKVNLNGHSILLPASALTVAGRGRPPKPVDL